MGFFSMAFNFVMFCLTGPFWLGWKLIKWLMKK